MTIKSSYTIAISQTAIETGLWHIHRELLTRYGTAQAQRDMDPLLWYVNTGRASLNFLHALFTAKPFMIARKLHMGGSYDEVISRLHSYLKQFDL